MQSIGDQMTTALVNFNTKLSSLSSNERAVLRLLVSAAKLIAPIYLLQENNKFPGANFYPHGVSKKEIEKAAQKDPLILNPYTIVEKKDDKFVVIPYHIKYSKMLKPISDKLLQAAKITDNNEFAKRLEIQANALME